MLRAEVVSYDWLDFQVIGVRGDIRFPWVTWP